MNEVELPKKNAFNFLRLICCIIVIYEHAIVLSGASFVCLGLRSIAVNVFFILSGFWVTQSYFRSSSLKDYWVKRCKKILPQYFLVIFASILFLSFFSSLPLKNYFFNKDVFKYFIANITTLNFIHPTLPGVFNGINDSAVNGSLWTIKIEIGFYIILPLIILFSKKKKSSTVENNEGGYGCEVIIILYLLSVFYRATMPIITERLQLPKSLINQLPAYISYFVSGMFFAFYKNIITQKLNYFVLPCFISFIICFILNLHFIAVLVEPICLTVITLWLGYNLPFSEIGRKLDLSYSLYLVHYPIIMCGIDCGLFETHWFFSLLCVFGLSFLFSFFM